MFGTDSNLGVPNSASATDTGDISANLSNGDFVGDGRMAATASPYSIGGFAGGFVDSGLTTSNNDVYWSANSFFRDELQFSTTSGAPARIDLDFNVTARLAVPVHEFAPGVLTPADTSLARLFIAMLYPTTPIPGTVPPLYNVQMLDNFGLEIRENASGTLEGVMTRNGVEQSVALDVVYDPFFDFDVAEIGFSDIVTFSTDAILGPDRLVASNSYLPFTLSAQGDAANALVDWEHTVAISDVRLYDADGNPLGPNDYTLLSPNDAFAAYNNTATTPVPAPSTGALLVAGLLTAARVRGRRR